MLLLGIILVAVLAFLFLLVAFWDRLTSPWR